MRWPFALLVFVLVGCAGSTNGGFRSEAFSGDDVQYAYVIPAGAGLAFDAGEPLDILPDRLDVSVGEVIQIRNDDSRGHLIGPFFVGAGETLRQRFSSVGEFTGVCTVHPNGQIIVAVS